MCVPALEKRSRRQLLLLLCLLQRGTDRPRAIFWKDRRKKGEKQPSAVFLDGVEQIFRPAYSVRACPVRKASSSQTVMAVAALVQVTAGVSANLSEGGLPLTHLEHWFLLFASLFHPMHCGFDGKISTNLAACYRPIGLEITRIDGSALVESQLRGLLRLFLPFSRETWRRVRKLSDA